MTAPFVKRPSKGDMLTEVVRQTGLSKACVKELLKAGWTYRTHINVPPMFVHPSARLKNVPERPRG